MELRVYLEILWRRKWVVAVTAIVTVTVVVIGTLTATPEYAASTTLRVATPKAGSLDYVYYEVRYADRLMNTYAQIATSKPVLKELVQKLELDQPPHIEVDILADTELMQITVEDPNPTLARDAANALVEILVAQSRELFIGDRETAQDILRGQLDQIEEELDQARLEYESLVILFREDSELISAASRSIELKEATYAVLLEQYDQARIRDSIQASALSVVEVADLPQAPSKPRKKLNIALGAMVGLMGGLGLAFLFENLDARLYTIEQIEEVVALTTLGSIPFARKQRQVGVLSGNTPHGEAFRRLRTRILTLDQEAPLRTLLVTSAELSEGKSTTVASLAVAMAWSGSQVIAVDSDLRRPVLHKVFDLPNGIGLSSILEQEATLEEAVQVVPLAGPVLAAQGPQGQAAPPLEAMHSKIPGVHVLTSGPLPPNPAELVGSPQMTALLKALAQRFDMVLLDSPSLLAVTDAMVLALMVDGVLLVVKCAHAGREAVRSARQQLANVKSRLVGVVVNQVNQSRSRRYYKYYRQPERAQMRDPLTKIDGIGPVYEKALNAIGILSFAQLAEQDPERLAEQLGAQFTAERICRDRWVEQAQTFVQAWKHR